MPTVRCRVNLSFDGWKQGEIVDADPVLCARYLERGWLSEVDDDGHRVLALDVLTADGGGVTGIPITRDEAAALGFDVAPSNNQGGDAPA